MCTCIYLAVLGCSCGMWDLRSLLWHVRLFFLSCSTWDLVLRPPTLGVRSLTHWTIREALDACISDVKPSILILTLTVRLLQEVVHCTCSHVYLVPGTHEHHCSQSRREADEQERTKAPSLAQCVSLQLHLQIKGMLIRGTCVVFRLWLPGWVLSFMS